MMPSTSASVSGGDEVRGRDGTFCKQGTHVGPTFDTGLSFTPSSQSLQSSGAPSFAPSFPSSFGPSQSQSSAQSQGFGIYARIVVPLGKQPARIDCTRLYELEVERLQAELARLKESGAASVVIK